MSQALNDTPSNIKYLATEYINYVNNSKEDWLKC
jgi:hypothetical protein